MSAWCQPENIHANKSEVSQLRSAVSVRSQASAECFTGTLHVESWHKSQTRKVPVDLWLLKMSTIMRPGLNVGTRLNRRCFTPSKAWFIDANPNLWHKNAIAAIKPGSRRVLALRNPSFFHRETAQVFTQELLPTNRPALSGRGCAPIWAWFEAVNLQGAFLSRKSSIQPCSPTNVWSSIPDTLANICTRESDLCWIGYSLGCGWPLKHNYKLRVTVLESNWSNINGAKFVQP